VKFVTIFSAIFAPDGGCWVALLATALAVAFRPQVCVRPRGASRPNTRPRLASLPVGKGFVGDRNRRRPIFLAAAQGGTSGLLKAVFRRHRQPAPARAVSSMARWSPTPIPRPPIPRRKARRPVRLVLANGGGEGFRDRAGTAGRSGPHRRDRRRSAKKKKRARIR